MDTIHIPELLTAPKQMRVIEFEEGLPDLETLTPVKGCLKVAHQGNYLEIKASAETIVTLSCDRCLQHYNHRLHIQVSEMIWLNDRVERFDEDGLEYEVALEDLVETLPPQGYFQPEVWLYEQLCLALPQRQLCDQECAGIPVPAQLEAVEVIPDRRWASLEALKGKFPL